MRSIGRFIVRERLGSGSEGEVYRCSDPVLRREVAIKLLHTPLLGGHGSGVDPLHEARALGVLSHQNLVSVFDAGELEGRPYLVFEFIEGRTLAELLTQGPLAQEAALEVLDGVLAGIEQAHAQGIVHRDLKPANILVTGAGVPKVADFGIAALLGSEQGPDEQRIGTPRYMAPEYIEGGEVSKRTDVFSLGLLAYEMLVGRPGYEGKDVRTLLRDILSGAPRPLDQVVPNVDPRLQRLVERALERNPAQRFADAAEMRQALKSVRSTSGQANTGAHATVAFLLRRMRLKQDFPALARNVSTLNQLASECLGDSRALAEIIVKDQGLSSKILRVVNSAYYAAFSGQISTISRAVVILGVNGVRAIAASLSLLEHFSGKVETEGLREHLSASLYSGLCAREIGHAVDRQLAEEAMLGTMLRGLGAVLVAYYFPEEAQLIERLEAVEGVSPADAQRQVLGTDYARIGQEVAREWNFPDQIRCCLEDRQSLPDRPVREDSERLQLIAGLADRVTAVLRRGRSAEALYELKRLVTRHAEVLDLEPMRISGAIHAAKREYLAFQVGFADRQQRQRFVDRLGEDGAQEPVVTTAAEPAGTGHTVILHTTRIEWPQEHKSRNPMEILDEAVERLERWGEPIDEGRAPSRVTMEALHRALGFQRLVTARWDAARKALYGLAGFGEAADPLVQSFRVRCVGGLNLLSVALIRDSDIYISDATRDAVRERMPDWLGQPGSFLVLPMRAARGPVGMLYAEYGLAYGFDEDPEVLQRVKALRDALCRCLAANTQLAMVR